MHYQYVRITLLIRSFVYVPIPTNIIRLRWIASSLKIILLYL